MKKVVSAFILSMASFYMNAQAILVVEAPQNNNSTSTVRAPNGTSAHAFMRGCFLVLASELTNIPVNTTLTTFGYTLNSGTTVNAVTGNYTLYLENTSNTSYSKGTTWSTAISGMTQVYASVLTIPVSAGTTSVMITLSTPFVFTGGGLYVAYDWASGTPYSTTPAVYLCESTALPLPGGGGGSDASATTPPSTLQVTNFRPSFLFGFANPYTNDLHVTGVSAPGRVSAMFNTPHQVTARVLNGSSASLGPFNVSLTVSGANSFTDIQTVPSLAAGNTTLITFAAFNPQSPGLNTVSVSVAADQNNNNNSLLYSQSVTCNEWSQQPATGSFTTLSVGFNTGTGILGVQYMNPVTSTLNAISIAISSNTATTGQSMYGVLLTSAGATIAVTSPKTITTAMLGTYVQFDFPFPPVLSANTTYYLGGAQTAGSQGYFPFGTQSAGFMPPNLYAYTGLAGGTMTQLGQNFGYFGITGVFNPTITLTATPQSVTCGNQATVSALSSTNYSWSTGAQTPSITVSPTVSSVYTVIATNTLGCVASRTVQVTVNPLPVNITASHDTICLGSAVTLSASGASLYSWSSGGSAAVIADSPQQTTVYTVTGSIAAGCVNSASVSVAVRNFSTMTVPAPQHTICQGSSATLTANGAATYTWTDGSATSNTPQLITSPTVSAIYTVTGADNLGCAMSRTAEVTVIVVPLMVSPDTAVCYGSALTLTATGAGSYSWSTGSPFNTLPINSVTVAGSYSVTGVGQFSCKRQAVVTVSVNPNPTVTASAKRSVMCIKESNTLTAGGASTYSWSTGSQNATVVITPTVNLPLSLKVTGYDALGCKNEATVSVLVQSCTGLDETAGEGIQVYPNPSAGIFNIHLPDNSGGEARIHNAAGSLIRTLFLPGDRPIVVDLSQQPAGLYILQVKQGSTWRATRLIRD